VVIEYKLNLVRPEPGAGDRMRNTTVFTREFELCQECAQAVWSAAEQAAVSSCADHKSGKTQPT
jgi:hypothetical protein